ncbi:hypothetical protein JCM10213v2_007413 [Rhodosporidiobolus nylandii]
MQAYLGQLRSFVDSHIAPLVPPSVSSALSLSPAPSPVEPFPPLPPELILRILSFILPPPAYTSAKTRALRLKQLALLDKDCARWAVLQLKADVALSSLDAARWFTLTARKRGECWTNAVRSVRLGSAEQFAGPEAQVHAVDRMWRGEGTGKAVSDLLKACANVDELWLCGISGVEVGHLAVGKNLRKLFITETRVVSSSASASASPPTIHLPHLHTLYLKSVIFTGHALPSLLTPEALPALRTLDYLSVHQSLVTPVAHPQAAAQQNGPLLLGAGGRRGTGLASMTAALAALSPPSPASSAPASSTSSTTSHPLLAVSSQLTSLSLGPHATPLSLPWSIFCASPGLQPADYPPTLRYLRITNDGRAPPPWNVDERGLFGLMTDEELRLEAGRRREVETGEAEVRGLEVFQHLGGSGSAEEERVLTLPALERELRNAGAAAEAEQRLFCRSASVSPPVDDGDETEAHGLWVTVEREDLQAREADGVWQLGADRWRERVERRMGTG